MPKILVLSPRWPLPPVDGARVASCELWSVLSGMGYEVDVLASVVNRSQDVPPQEVREKLGVRSIERFPRLSRTRQIARKFVCPGWPFTVLSLGEAGYRERFLQCLESGEFGLIIVDALHAAEIFLRDPRLQSVIRQRKTRIIYRAHNVEAEIWNTKATQTPLLKRGLFRFEARAVERAEKKLCALSDQIWTVSDEDARYFQKNWKIPVPCIPVRISQFFPESPPARPKTTEVIRLGFLGSLDWGPNREGLVWFLDHVWPGVYPRRADLEVVVAGSRAGPDLIRRLKGTPGVSFLGQVASVQEFYDRIDLFLVPIFYGSGTRVKAIEASKEAVPCLSTALGVMGVGLEPGVSYIHCESAHDWIRALRGLSRSPETLRAMGVRAFEAARSRFSREAVRESIQQAVLQLGLGSPPQ